jgi:hypothetical protein
MSAVGIIPARFGATRFPGKPLAPIAGRPMIERVWRGALEAKRLRAVIVATDDERIAEACRGFGAEVEWTSPDHPTGTDRLAEVAARLDARLDAAARRPARNTARGRAATLSLRAPGYGASSTLHCVVGLRSASNAAAKPSKPTRSVIIGRGSIRPAASMSSVKAKSALR